MFALTRILVPTNLGDPSRAALQYGVAFARRFDAKLYLLHVLDAKRLDAALETERVLEVLSADAEGRTAKLAEDARKALNGRESQALKDAEDEARKGLRFPRPAPRPTNGRH